MSSQKKKTPAEELMESLLNEVEDTGEDQKLEGFALDSDESMGDLKAAPKNKKSTAEADADLELKGIVQLDASTVVGNMNFEGFLRDNRGGVSLEKTQIHSPAAKTEVKTQVETLVQNQIQTQIQTQIQSSSQDPMDLFNVNEPTEIQQEAKTTIQSDFSSEEASPYEATRIASAPKSPDQEHNTEFGELEFESMDAKVVDLSDLAVEPQPSPVAVEVIDEPAQPAVSIFDEPKIPAHGLDAMATKAQAAPKVEADAGSQVATVAISIPSFDSPPAMMPPPMFAEARPQPRPAGNDGESTVAVTGFQIKPEENLDGKVKVSVGQSSRSSGFSSWSGGIDGNLNQAENLRMAQEKIIEIENENERLRRQNEELIAASEILKERSDLMMSQLSEYKNDREGLEQSFKNEMTLLKNHLVRKDAELKKAQFKVEELEARLKFDLKKIRVRERELENRLELVRAEKNAISKNKDEQILDLRRKMDVIQMEVDSYRQKCVELNKQIENSQDSFKRTTRALRLAMANLELQEENKGQLKKAE